MTAYNFQSCFADMFSSDQKRQTIRIQGKVVIYKTKKCDHSDIL